MKTHTRLTVLMAVLLAALAACAPKDGALQPPEIAYGQDLCEQCGMLIDQPQLAAASLTTDGTAHKFDEIGDMVQYHNEHPTEQVEAWFVHDYETEAWIRAETAFFIYSPQLATPMGHGLAAFETEADAQALAGQFKAEVLSFDGMRAVMHTMEHAGH
jgi:copper chaperone NosL